MAAAAAFLGAAPAGGAAVPRGAAPAGGAAVPRGAAPAGGAAAARAATPEFHPVIPVHAPGIAVNAAESSNWSGYSEGYLDTGTPFSSVSGEWAVPTATQHTARQAESSATWVGIGGGCLSTSCTETDPTLIQAGTEQNVSASGAASYTAWWEILPLPSMNAGIPVHPGDHITCAISSMLPGMWNITLQDLTDGHSFSETIPYMSMQGTAEWAEESPLVIGTSQGGIAALPDLGAVSFSNATANGQSAGLVPGEAIQLVGPGGVALATPSAPDAAGEAFNDCTYTAACRAP